MRLLHLISMTLLLGLVGCSSITQHSISRNALSDREVLPSGFLTSATFAIAPDPSLEPLFARELQRKIEKLLVNKHFQLSHLEEADYLLFFTAGVAEQTLTSYMPIYSPGEIASSSGSISRGDGSLCSTYAGSTQMPGTTAYVPVCDSLFIHTLTLTVYSAKPLKKEPLILELFNHSKQEAVEITPNIDRNKIWTITCKAQESGSDLRTISDLLLLEAFKEFGIETLGEVNSTIDTDNPQLKQLRTF